MSKNSKKATNRPDIVKPIGEMTDAEFISSIDYLSDSYYRAYLEEYNNRAAGIVRPAGTEAVPAAKESGAGGKKEYVKKRRLPIFLILILMLACLAVSVIGFGFFEIKGVSEYLAVCPDPKSGADYYIGVTEPIKGWIDRFAGTDSPSASDSHSDFNEIFIGKDPGGAPADVKAWLFLVPIAGLILLICAFFGSVRALIALFKGRNKAGFYKKYGFGFLSLLIFVCAALLTVGMYALAGKIPAICSGVPGFSENFGLGYGPIIIAAASVLSLIFGGAAYAKRSKTRA